MTIDGVAGGPRTRHEPRIWINRAKGAVVIGLRGALDRAVLDCFAAQLADLTTGQGNLRVVIDLSDVKATEDRLTRAITDAQTDLARRGGSIAVLGRLDEHRVE